MDAEGLELKPLLKSEPPLGRSYSDIGMDYVPGRTVSPVVSPEGDDDGVAGSDVGVIGAAADEDENRMRRAR